MLEIFDKFHGISDPLFTCQIIDNEEYSLYYCVAQKLVLLTDFILFCLLIRLIVQKFKSKKIYKFSKTKKTCLLISLVNILYVYYHYGLGKPYSRASNFFILEVFRFIIMSLLCCYYCDKATGLLYQRSAIMRNLKVFIIVGSIIIINEGRK